MKIFHHNDDDGYCSAAIVFRYLINMWDIPTENDFFVYSYGKEITLPEINTNETVYIVDLALDANIMKLIMHCVDNEANVIHIDHHESTQKYMEKASPTAKAYLDAITHFYENGISASLMTYAYSCFTDEMKRNPENVSFYDANECRDLFIEDMPYPYSIPLAVRYINDYDIWKFDLKETLEFHEGFYSSPWRTKPWDDGWKRLFMSENALVPPIIESGTAIVKHTEKRYESIRKNAFVHLDSEGNECICINTDSTDSKVFGDLLQHYDYGCLFKFDGKVWHNSLRSSDEGINVADIAEKHGGGGHAHAAGFQSDECIWIQKFTTTPEE